MTLHTAKTESTEVRETALAPFMPGRTTLKEFATRLKQSLSYRGADKLNDHELLALAAASRAHGLNPYLGEIWAIPGKGLMIGRAGWVKKINEKLDNRGIRWWPQYLEIRPHERAQFGVPEDARLAYICELRRQDQVSDYISNLERLNTVGISGEQAIAMLGNPPVIKGVGYIASGETAPGETIPGSTSKQGYMSLGERCKKRAFAQAAKEMIDLPFQVYTEGDAIDGVLVDGEEYGVLEPDDGFVVSQGEEYASPPEQTGMPFPPDKRLNEFVNKDWTAFWPFMAKRYGLRQKDVGEFCHDAANVKSLKECAWTFSQMLDACDAHIDAWMALKGPTNDR